MVTEKLVDSYLCSGITAYTGGDFQTAGKMFFAAYQKSKNYSKTDPRLAYVYTNLALFYFQQKRYKKCETLLQQALEIMTRAEQFHTPLADNVRTQLANVYLLQQKHTEVLSLYKVCLHQFQDVGNYPESSQLYDRIIELYGALGKFRQAEIWCKQAVAYDKQLNRQNEAAAKKRMIRLAWIYSQQGRSQDACETYQRALDKPVENIVQTPFPQANVRTAYLAI